jgi:hypothetical protein
LEGARARFLDLRVRDEKLHWQTDDKAPLTLTDASLEEVLRRLQGLHTAGTAEPATVREAIRLFEEFAKEAGL